MTEIWRGRAAALARTAAVLGWAGCTGAPPQGHTADTAEGSGVAPTSSCGPATLELGTGVDAFVPVVDDQELAMVHGSQGGYHLPLALRECGMGDVAQTHVLGTVTDDGLTVVDLSLGHDWRAIDACCGVLLDLRGFLYVDDYEWTPLSLHGVTVEVSAEVVDGGATYSDGFRVRVLAPADEL